MLQAALTDGKRGRVGFMRYTHGGLTRTDGEIVAMRNPGARTYRSSASPSGQRGVEAI